MTIRELLQDIDYRVICGDAGTVVRGVAIDSRLVRPGDLFVATVGREADGHEYVPQARAAGAAAALIMDDHAGQSCEVDV
jgi:UDP-N-acetylmuramyl pentapeptide synthase